MSIAASTSTRLDRGNDARDANLIAELSFNNSSNERNPTHIGIVPNDFLSLSVNGIVNDVEGATILLLWREFIEGDNDALSVFNNFLASSQHPIATKYNDILAYWESRYTSNRLLGLLALQLEGGDVASADQRLADARRNHPSNGGADGDVHTCHHPKDEIEIMLIGDDLDSDRSLVPGKDVLIAIKLSNGNYNIISSDDDDDDDDDNEFKLFGAAAFSVLGLVSYILLDPPNSVVYAALTAVIGALYLWVVLKDKLLVLFAKQTKPPCTCGLGCGKTVPEGMMKYLMTLQCTKNFLRMKTQKIHVKSRTAKGGRTTKRVHTYHSPQQICEDVTTEDENGNSLLNKAVGPEKVVATLQPMPFILRVHPSVLSSPEFEASGGIEALTRAYKTYQAQNARASKTKKQKREEMTPAELKQFNASCRNSSRASYARNQRFRRITPREIVGDGGRTEEHENHPGIVNRYDNSIKKQFSGEVKSAVDNLPGKFVYDSYCQAYHDISTLTMRFFITSQSN